MECRHEDTADGVRIIRLTGRMDIEGNEQVALRFDTLTTDGGPAVVVDLSGVEFLSSLGISTIVSGAKNVQRRKGVLALFGARPNVLSALERTNIPGIIPTCSTLAEARARAMASVRP
jgi:anti-sigma B factor antagonist